MVPRRTDFCRLVGFPGRQMSPEKQSSPVLLFLVQAIRVVELSPEHFKSCKLEEGEWGAVGSIVTWTYVLDGKSQVHGNTESSTVTWTFEYEKISEDVPDPDSCLEAAKDVIVGFYNLINN
ncbi:kirola-like protein [Tanacetum coccineum]